MYLIRLGFHTIQALETLTMVRRRRPRTGSFGEQLFQEAVDIVGDGLLNKLQGSVHQALNLPPSAESMRQQVWLNRSELQLEHSRRRMALAEQKQATTEANQASRHAQVQGRLILQGQRSRLYDLEIAKAELDVERQRQRLEAGEHLALPAGVAEPIKGALDFRANPSGISGDARTGYMAWLDSLELGKVILILGKRGSGKTAFSCKLAEYVFAAHQVPVWMVGVPTEIAPYLPTWISLTMDIEQVDLGAFVIIDESGLQYMAMRYQSDANTIMHKLLQIARHRRQSLIFACQVAADVDKSIIRQADCIVFKQPNLMQPKNDRPEVRDAAARALKIFEGLPKEERLQTAYIHDADFEGVLQYELPEWWREELSFAFANVSLSEGKNGALDAPAAARAELDQAEIKRKVLELRRDGLGYQRIAGALGVGIKRVRNIVDEVEGEGHTP